MKARITVLGAGFAGMELSTILSESLAEDVQVTLIDKSDAFVFGYSKLDVMFGRTTLDAVRLPYRNFAKPGVRLLRETVQAIDPATRRVTTDAGTPRLPTTWWSRWAPTTTSRPPRDWQAPTSSTRWPVRIVCARSCPPSPRAAPSSAFAGRRTSARRHPANAR